MDPRLLRYYNSELQHLREVGNAFAKEFPKIAGRLGLDEFECADPYVERLLEGFAFLTARIQLKLDAEFPRFAQHLFEIVYPHYLAPTPSMTVVQFQPDLAAGSLEKGATIPRQTALQSAFGAGEETACQYQTVQDVTLWPIELVAASYTAGASVDGVALARTRSTKAVLRLRFRVCSGLSFGQLPIDSLRLFLRGADQLPNLIYEEVVGNGLGVIVKSVGTGTRWAVEFGPESIQRVGFADEDALLPSTPRSFSGYRLLHEYFAFPQRFLFVDLVGLKAGMQRAAGSEVEVLIPLRRHQQPLERSINESHFALFCTPAANVFAKRCDRLHMSNRQWEHHVVPDRTRPMDFEIYRLTEVEGFGTGAEVEQVFRPFYAASEPAGADPARAYYQVRRAPRMVPARRTRDDLRTSYVGSEVFVSLVDAHDLPWKSNLRQLGVSALCTNRDLPITMPIGIGSTDFNIESGVPVVSIRCVVGPTRPRPSYIGGDAEDSESQGRGEISWRFISHMSLNYLSLCDRDAMQGAAALRELLRLYSVVGDEASRRQIEGVRSVASKPITRRIPAPGPIAYGRGLEIALEFDHTAFEGTGVFLLGAVLERFFAQYASINGFTETVVHTKTHGEIMRWPARIGLRHVI